MPSAARTQRRPLSQQFTAPSSMPVLALPRISDLRLPMAEAVC
jgi:hypothetical protein